MELRSPKIFLYLFILSLALAALRMGYITFIMDSIQLKDRLKLDRGDILDRNGNILATSVPAYSIYINNKKKPPLPRKKITKIIGLKPHWTNRLQSNEVFLLKRYLSQAKAKELKQLGQEALLFEKVLQRVHPYGNHLSHTLGLVDVHSTGLSGLEKSMGPSYLPLPRRPRMWSPPLISNCKRPWKPN